MKWSHETHEQYHSFKRRVQVAVGIIIAVSVADFTVVYIKAALGNDAPTGDYVLQTKTQTYGLEAVSSSEAMARGLGGRTSLASNGGMIFVYPNSAERCFWMKDMQFSLDILWVDTNRKVTHLEEGVSPKTYPRQYCAEAKYVIELNAGEVRKNNLSVGSRLEF